MQFKIFKSDKYQWTQHSLFKMRQYGLSPQRVIRVIRNPERTEEGIVEKTIAVMQKASTNKKSGEIWCMYQLRGGANSKSQISNSKNPHPALSLLGRGGNEKIKIISAWRYPGISPKNNPIPEEILQELAEIALS